MGRECHRKDKGEEKYGSRLNLYSYWPVFIYICVYGPGIKD